MFGQLSGQKESHSRLNLPTGDGRPFVVMAESTGFTSNSLEDVVDEGVHNRHRLRADSSVGMDLFQHLIDVAGVGLLPPPLLLLVGLSHFRGFSGFFSSLCAGLGWHFSETSQKSEKIGRGNGLKVERESDNEPEKFQFIPMSWPLRTSVSANRKLHTSNQK